MKLVYALTALALLMSQTVQAGTQCREAVDGEVTCWEVSEEVALDSAVHDGNDDEESDQADPAADIDNSVGDRTSQSRENGMTY